MAKYKVSMAGQVTAPTGEIVSPQMQAQPQGQQAQDTQKAIIQLLASNAANQQLQNQAQAQQQVQEQDPLRGIVNEMIKNKLVEKIDSPKFTTIQDVLGAQKGERLNTFLDYLNTPEASRIIGGFIPSYGYNPRTGQARVSNVMEEDAQRQEAQMQQAQKQALERQSAQEKLANDMYGYYQQKDIKEAEAALKRELAKQELDWAREKFGQELALDRAKTNAQIQHQRNMEALGWYNARNKGATGGAAGVGNRKLTAAEIKQMQKNQEALNSLNAIQGQMDRFKNSFGKVRGSKAGALLANAYASGGFGNEAESNFNAQRTLLFNKIARELGGEKGVLSDQDIKRIEGSLPSLSDSLPQKKAKMKAVYDLLEDRKSQYSGYSSGATSLADPMGLGL